MHDLRLNVFGLVTRSPFILTSEHGIATTITAWITLSSSKVSHYSKTAILFLQLSLKTVKTLPPPITNSPKQKEKDPLNLKNPL